MLAGSGVFWAGGNGPFRAWMSTSGYDGSGIIIRVMRYDGWGGVLGHDGMQMIIQGEMALAGHFRGYNVYSVRG